MDIKKINELVEKLESSYKESSITNKEIEGLFTQLKQELKNEPCMPAESQTTKIRKLEILNPVSTPMCKLKINCSKEVRTQLLELAETGLIQVRTIADKTNLKSYTTHYGKGKNRGRKGGSFK